ANQQLAPNPAPSSAPAQQPAQPAPQPGMLFRRLLAGALDGLSAGLQGESLDEAKLRQAQTQQVQQQTANARQSADIQAKQAPFELQNWQLRNQLTQAQIQAIADSQE